MSSSSSSDRDVLVSGVLQSLSVGAISDSREWFAANFSELSCGHDALEAVLKSLEGSEMVTLKNKNKEAWELTEEGKKYLSNGTPEAQLFRYVQQHSPSSSSSSSSSSSASASASASSPSVPSDVHPLSSDSLKKHFGDEFFKIANTNAMKNKWLSVKDKIFIPVVSSIHDEVPTQLQHLEKQDKNTLNGFKRRNLIVSKTVVCYEVQKGKKFTLERKELATDLTKDLLKNDKWKEVEFKPYNWSSEESLSTVGCLHPLLKVRNEFRNILLEMGFSEMPTARFIESSFWNFDALFQPQQHPARDSHDTFFIKTPGKTLTVDSAYCERVKSVHEHGGFGSIGYRYDWKWDEAEKNILRTHTTAISTRMLYQLAQQKPFKPSKFFSIDRVFRNETLDATHLAEFHQVEGLVADRHLSLGDLMGVIRAFFSRIGIETIKFKPAYNPYTEPSMEIFGYSPELKRWIEIGNSGIFRPEMLRPMGFSDDISVIAWGLSLERPTMIKYGINNIRKLFGPGVSLDIIKQNGIARFDNPAALVDNIGKHTKEPHGKH